MHFVYILVGTVGMFSHQGSNLAMSSEAKTLFDRLGGHAVALEDFELVE